MSCLVPIHKQWDGDKGPKKWGEGQLFRKSKLYFGKRNDSLSFTKSVGGLSIEFGTLVVKMVKCPFPMEKNPAFLTGSGVFKIQAMLVRSVSWIVRTGGLFCNVESLKGWPSPCPAARPLGLSTISEVEPLSPWMNHHWNMVPTESEVRFYKN